MKPTYFVLFFALLNVPEAHAQPVANASAPQSSWDTVARLAAGTRVEVIHGALKSVRGEFVTGTEQALTIRSADNTTSVIARTEVRRVSLAGTSRKKRTLIGMAIGAAVGAVAVLAGGRAGDIDIRSDILIGAGAVVGAGAGAAVGALTGGQTTIYRAP